MSGTLKIGSKILATHNSTTNIAKIQLGSANDVVLADSAGNSVLSESSGVVTLKNTKLQTTTTAASYSWNGFNGPNLTGTIGNASSSGNALTSDYVTLSNSSGTLTITCLVAGRYNVVFNYYVIKYSCLNTKIMD